jgi:hypothetical protein
VRSDFSDPGLRADGLEVVDMLRREEFLDVGEGYEDDDCESDSKETDGSMTEALSKDDKNGESLPVLKIGSFARYAHRKQRTSGF